MAVVRPSLLYLRGDLLVAIRRRTGPSVASASRSSLARWLMFHTTTPTVIRFGAWPVTRSVARSSIMPARSRLLTWIVLAFLAGGPPSWSSGRLSEVGSPPITTSCGPGYDTNAGPGTPPWCRAYPPGYGTNTGPGVDPGCDGSTEPDTD